MYYATDLKIEMENEVKANEALKVINSFLSQIEDEYDYVKELTKDLSIIGNSVMVIESHVLDDASLFIVPEIFKIIAQNNPLTSFKGYVDYYCDCTNFSSEATFEKRTLKYHSIYFPDGTDYFCPDEDCGEWLANYEELMENKTFTCPNCGKVYTADELAGERPEITNETWYIK